MAGPNQQIVNRYFEAYGRHDMDAIREVMSEEITWYFLGRHPLAGIRHGVDEVVAFFDTMGSIMMQSKPQMEKLMEVENDRYFLECQHSRTNRTDGHNLDHYTCVLWTIGNGKIVEGRHFFADPAAVDAYFTGVAPGNN